MYEKVTGHNEPIIAAEDFVNPGEVARFGTVLSIEDFKLRSGWSRRGQSCKHRNLTYTVSEKRIWCEDCESTVDTFDAMMLFAAKFSDFQSALKRREEKLLEDEKQNLISRAAKAIDRAFRRRGKAARCPHCKTALLPEDITGIDEYGYVNADWERKRREAEANKSDV